MTAAGPIVLVLLGVALLVALLTVLVALGKIDVSMAPPDNPWWAARRRRRRAAQGQETPRPEAPDEHL